MTLFEWIAVIVVGYFLGAIPFAYIITKRQGVDIFTVGSGNVGATNVTRALGKRYGRVCFALDCLKGFIAAGWPLLGSGDPVALGVIGLIAAIIGHTFSVFIKFRGGKGVSVSMGGLLALSPLVLILSAIIWALVYFFSRYVSLASISFAISLPIFGMFMGVQPILGFFMLAIAIVIIVLHRENIKRLLKGKENRFK